MSARDKDLAGGAIYQINKERRGHQMGDCAGDKCPDWITRQVAIITDALTTTRKEARAAAFKDAVDAVRAKAKYLGQSDRQVAAQQVNGCLRAIDAIQAAANTVTPAESTRVGEQGK